MQLLALQRTEITEHHLYLRLAAALPVGHNREVLERIAADELRHYEVWRAYTGRAVAPIGRIVWLYYVISRMLGLTFGLKLMERGEKNAQVSYSALREVVPEAAVIEREEEQHEHEVLSLLDEERLRYIGSIVLGLNDALVELTGALAGLTLALRNTKLIALTGMITGFAAALSMGASEYLSTRTEVTTRNPRRAALYTTVTYVGTVVVLILPYLLVGNYYLCLACSLALAVVVIAAFNYYVSVARDESFRHRFLEMAALSFSVAALSFGIGFVLRHVLGVSE